MRRICVWLALSVVWTAHAQDGLTPPVKLQQGQARSWAELAADVDAGQLNVSPEQEGRLLTRAMQALHAGNGNADLFVSALLGRRLEPYRRDDGTIDWAKAKAVALPVGEDGIRHVGLPLFLKEAARVVKTADPERIDELVLTLGPTDVLAQLGLLGAGMAGASNLMEASWASTAGARRLPSAARIRVTERMLKNGLVVAVGLSIYAVAGEEKVDGVTQIVMPFVSMTAASFVVKSAALRFPWLRRGPPPSFLTRAWGMARATRALNLTYVVGEVVVTLILAEAMNSTWQKSVLEERGRAPLRKAARDLTNAARSYRLQELSMAELELALQEYQRAWATYRNVLYRNLAQADASFADHLSELEREASRNRVKRETALGNLEKFPAVFRAQMRNKGLEFETVADYRAHLAQQDAVSTVEDWESAADRYNETRKGRLSEVYFSALREGPFFEVEGQGRFERDEETFLDAHHDRISQNRLQTYVDEGAALTFLFEHLLRDDATLAEIRAGAESLRSRQEELDRRLTDQIRPDSGGQEGLSQEGLIQGVEETR